MVRFLLPSISSNSPSFNHFYIPIPTMPCKSFCDQTPYGQKNCFKVCKMWPEHILPHPVFPPPPPPFSPLHRDTLPGKTLLLLSIAITASSIFGFFMVCILFKKLLRYYYSRDLMRRNRAILFDIRENSPDDNDGGQGPVMDNHFWYVNTIGFQQSVIDSITMFQYKKDERLVDGTECSVCLGDFEENDSLRLLPKCNHAFHVPCIDTWLRSHKNCPVCRAPIMSNIAASHESISHGEREREMEEIPEEGNSILSRNNQLDEEGIGGVRRVSEIPMKEFARTSIDLSEKAKQTMRRSVSLDSVSASVIHKEMKNIETPNEASSSSGNGKAKNIEKQGMGNHSQSILNMVKRTSSIGRCSMKRINSSGKKLFSYSHHSRSQSSVLPL